MCEPSGPRQNSVSVFHRKESYGSVAESSRHNEGKDESSISLGGYDFKTVDDKVMYLKCMCHDLFYWFFHVKVKVNHTIISNLRPGIRYQFRFADAI